MQKKLYCNIHDLMLIYIWVCQFNFFEWKIFCVNFSVNLPLKKIQFYFKRYCTFFCIMYVSIVYTLYISYFELGNSIMNFTLTFRDLIKYY